MSNYPVIILILLLVIGVSLPLSKPTTFKVFKPVVFMLLTFILVLSFLSYIHISKVGPSTITFGGWNATIGIIFVNNKLSALLSLFVLFMSWLIVMYALKDMEHHIPMSKFPSYFTLIFLMLFSMLGMIYTQDLFNMYVFMEILSLTSAAIISIKNKRENILAAFRYLLLNTIGSLSILLGIALLYMVTGYLNMQEVFRVMPNTIAAYPLNITLSIGFMVMGLGIKAAMFPLHVWLPDAHSSAPSPSSALLSGVVVKIYMVMLVKLIYETFGPLAFEQLNIALLLQVLAVAGMFMGSIFAIGQKDIKRMLAYSSVAQIGYIFLGLSLLTNLGLSAALFHVISHALLKSALFLSAGAIIYKLELRDLRKFDGVGYVMPLSMAVFTVSALGMVGIPGVSGFMSKVYLSLAVVDAQAPWLLVAILVSSYLNAVYYLPVIINAFLKNDSKKIPSMVLEDIPLVMKLPLIVLFFAMMTIGFYPQIVKNAIDIAVMGFGG